MAKFYYNIRKTAPELFKNRDPLSPEVQQCLDHQEYVRLPNHPNGDHVLLCRLSSPKASDYNFEEVLKTFFMVIDSGLRKSGPRNGAVFLFDMEHYTLKHLMRISPATAKKESAYLQEGVPGKLRSIHILNASLLASAVISVIRPFVSSDILNLVRRI